MNRLVVGACAVALCALPTIGPTPAAAPDMRSLPMQFSLRTEGPAETCADRCRTWVAASGAVTVETARDFDAFAKQNDLKGATIAFDSDGGSVIGALALGRSIRRLGMTTTVGRTVDLPGEGPERRAKLNPRAYCESMCAFILLGGVERQVPPEARVMVHQIWLGDRREDPTAANYSAEDLVLVQRDIGRLAQYTVEMGGGIELLEVALKIPPWEPMRLLSREELRGMKIVTNGDGPIVASAAPVLASLTPANGSRLRGRDRSWLLGEKSGQPVLSRKHPLTVEGDDLGYFELTLACNEGGKDYNVTYNERRRPSNLARTPQALTEVEMSLAGKLVALKVVSMERTPDQEMISVATGVLPADVVQSFADPRSRSLTVETTSDDLATAIRVGNAGMSRVFPQLSAGCAQNAKIAKGPAGATAVLRREAEAHPPR